MAFFQCDAGFKKYTTDMTITSSSHTFSYVESLVITGLRLKSWSSYTNTGVTSTAPSPSNYSMTFKVIGVTSGTTYATLTYNETSSVTYLSANGTYNIYYNKELNPSDEFVFSRKGFSEQIKIEVSGKIMSWWNFVVEVDYA